MKPHGLCQFILNNSVLDNENVIDSFLQNLDRKQPIVMFGAGFALRRILLQLEYYGLNIVCICDNDISKQGDRFNNRYEILSLEKCMSRFPEALYIISAPLYFWEIKSDLEKKLDKKQICDIDFECSHYFRGSDFKSYFIQNLQRFESLSESLQDDISRITLQNIIQAHISGKKEDFESACTAPDDWYLFKSLLRPRPDSVYVDCGAYDGDTVLLFNQCASDGYRSIFAFEPDETVHRKLMNRVAEHSMPNVQIIKKGAYDFEGTLEFEQGGVYSKVANANQSLQPASKPIKVNVTTIDSVLNGRFVDTLKMDIEGAEKKALIGAIHTLKKHKPRLAICLYHNITDFLEIPELILQTVPEYKLYLRHHSKSCTDTILYAIF